MIEIDPDRAATDRLDLVATVGGRRDAHRAVRVRDERDAQAIERVLVGRMLVGLDHDRATVVTFDAHVAERILDLDLLERTPRRRELDPRALDHALIGGGRFRRIGERRARERGDDHRGEDQRALHGVPFGVASIAGSDCAISSRIVTPWR